MKPLEGLLVLDFSIFLAGPLCALRLGNFRPGVMRKLGLDYESAKGINPRIVYGAISGYGNEGPWAEKPGQDLLAQSLSGITWLSGDGGEGAAPVPMGLSAGDMFAGH